MMPRTLITFEELQKVRREWSGQTMAFVPTMGALHEGHLSLVKQAKQMADRVVVSIFVNPMQFGPKEDFSKYPRTLQRDLELLEPLEVDAVFTPNSAEMYPEGFQTKITNSLMATGLCGRSRPGHFDGVLTVVAKLFGLVSPTWAIFGKKDFQQWRLIEQMVRDLAMSVRVIGADIIRESDGLAMSSRNRYLPEDRRSHAAQIYTGLKDVQQKFQAGERNTQALRSHFSQHLERAGGFKVDYAEIRTFDRLEECGDTIAAPAVFLVAVFYEGVRLLDNMELKPS